MLDIAIAICMLSQETYERMNDKKSAKNNLYVHLNRF